MIIQHSGDRGYPKTDTVDAIGDKACREPDNRTEKQITGIVYAHVYAGVAGDDSPKHEKSGDRSIFE